MSTASLPSYRAETRDTERLLAQRLHVRRPQSNFIKNSRSGGLALRLIAQQEDVATDRLPEYSPGAVIEGTLNLKNADSVQSVDVKVRLFLVFNY